MRALENICSKKDVRLFLFSGPSGTGKTTLARIVARVYGCDDVLEVDAASKSGVNDMREVQDTIRYKSFGGSGMRGVIIDEAHGQSKQAFDSLLKIIEEPPEHVVWFFCTTNPAKVPATIKSRCAQFQLREVADKALLYLLDYVCQRESIALADGVADMLVSEAGGSPRQLLSNLVVARVAQTKKEAAELLKAPIKTEATLELCRFVADGGGSWPKCMSLLEKIEEPPETVRILISNYLAACLRKAKDDKRAIFYIEKMEAFSQSYENQSGDAQLLLSLGRALFGG